jgi:tetratricopeptide (TPR) repeat protein
MLAGLHRVRQWGDSQWNGHLARSIGRLRTEVPVLDPLADISVAVSGPEADAPCKHRGVERDAALERVRAELARGEYLLAYDAAREATSAFPDDLEVGYTAALALARSGAVDKATEELETARLASVSSAPDYLAQDIAALEARLAKDKAIRATGPIREQLAREAAARYEDVYRRFEHPYPCINAATMWRLAGDAARSAELGRTADAAAAAATPRDEADEYWLTATRAEAALLRDDVAAARTLLGRAHEIRPNDLAARAATRRQLTLLCEHQRRSLSLLDALPVPSVLHYCGHRVSTVGRGRLSPRETDRVAEDVAAYLDERAVGFGYGSLASGADILVAEALIARGAELQVFLPCPSDEFATISVADAGENWVRRFERCLAEATSVTVVDDGPTLGDEVLFRYCARVAMGRALIRAEFLTADAEQLAVWNGRAEGSSGTGAEVAAWNRRGKRTHTVRSGAAVGRPVSTPGSRVIRAMLFADVQGFSTLDDTRMTTFASTVLAVIAEILARYGSDVLNRRTWGDGLHVLFSGVIPAARCALDLQEAIGAFDWSRAGFDHPLGLRIGAHVGPVVEVHDPVTGVSDFTGRHIVRTARIEPRTPPGQVYVTDPFAALVTLEGDSTFSCQYVGRIPTAKEHGTFPMYVLRGSTG